MKSNKGVTPTKCAVPNCTNQATFIVMLEDYSSTTRSRRGPLSGAPNFCEQDKSLPFICTACAERNEDEATGIGRSRNYPFTKWGANHGRCSGWTTYRDIKTKKEVFI